MDLDLDLDVDVDGLVRGKHSRYNIYQIALYLCMSTALRSVGLLDNVPNHRLRRDALCFTNRMSKT